VERLERVGEVLTAGAVLHVEHDPSSGSARCIGRDHEIGTALTAEREASVSVAVEPTGEGEVEFDPEAGSSGTLRVEADALAGRAEIEEAVGAQGVPGPAREGIAVPALGELLDHYLARCAQEADGGVDAIIDAAMDLMPGDAGRVALLDALWGCGDLSPANAEAVLHVVTQIVDVDQRTAALRRLIQHVGGVPSGPWIAAIYAYTTGPQQLAALLEVLARIPVSEPSPLSDAVFADVEADPVFAASDAMALACAAAMHARPDTRMRLLRWLHAAAGRGEQIGRGLESTEIGTIFAATVHELGGEAALIATARTILEATTLLS
jgi:hypothetical protein